jgi:hypothetical protein
MTPDTACTDSPSHEHKEWYYYRNGSKIGPVTEAEMIDLALKRRIRHKTSVWRQDMKHWQALANSPLAHICKQARAPLSLADVPPNDGIAWAMAFWPIVLGGFYYGYLEYYPYPVSIGNVYSFGFFILVLLGGIDLCHLSFVGAKIHGLELYAILVAPVYLFKRAVRVHGTNLYAWVFLGASLLLLMTTLLLRKG